MGVKLCMLASVRQSNSEPKDVQRKLVLFISFWILLMYRNELERVVRRTIPS